MANSNAIKAGNAYVSFNLSTKGLSGQLAGIQAKFRSMGQGLRNIGSVGLTVGGSITGAFAAAAKIFADAGSRLADMSGRTGLSVESLSELDHAAKLSGTSLEDVEKAAKQMQKDGIDPKRFDEYADKIAAIEDPVKRAQEAMEVFGKKTGTALLPMLAELPKLRKEARELGLVMSSEDAAAADTLGDSMDTLLEQVKMVVVQIGAAVAGPLTDLLDMIKPILAATIEWVKNNRPLVATIAAVGVGIAGLGAVLVATGIGFSFIATAIGGFLAAGGMIVTVLGAIISPFGLLTAAIVGGIAAFAMFTETGQGMVARIVEAFGWLNDTVMTSISAIGAALSAGDIALAGEVLWSSLKLLWLQGTQSIRETWYSMTGGIVKAWHTAWAGMLQLANAVFGNLERGWSHTTEFFGNLWDSVVGAMQVSLNNLIGFFQKAWAYITGASDSEIARINKEVTDSNAILSGDRDASKQARSDAAEKACQQSRDLQQATLDVIGKELSEKLNATDKGTADKVTAARAQLESARTAWQDATAAANQAAADAAAEKANAVTQKSGGGVGAALDSVSSRGTFNAVNLLGLQGTNGPESETAKNTKKTTEILSRMERSQTGKLVLK